MVNEEKIRIMIKLAAYETGVPKKEIKEGGFYKSDYIRSRLIVTIWSYSMAYFLFLALLVLYHFEYLVSDVGMQDIESLIVSVVAIYVMILFGCVFFTSIVYSSRYNRTQKRQKEYYNELKRLETFYVQNKEGGNG